MSNRVSIICGPRGVGKTSKARELVQEALEDGRWVFAHDPVAQYRGLCRSYDSIGAWRAAMASAHASQTALERGAAFVVPPLELVALVDELGQKHNSAIAARFPMTLVFDESALLAQGTHVAEGMMSLLALARHRQCELVFLVQRKPQLVVGFWEMATDCFLFRQPSGASDLESPLSLPKGSLAGLASLERFEYVHVRSGEGLI